MDERATCRHAAREEKTIMMAFAAMEPERLAFLSELYTAVPPTRAREFPMRR
jgi:hypothetical protein